MNPVARAFNSLGGSLMARTGRVGILVTTGRRSGLPRRAGLGYQRRPDGSVVVAAGATGRAWAANLRANPAATFGIKGATSRYAARLVEGDERTTVLAAFVEHLGGSARRAHWNEVFVLEPVDGGAG